MQIEEYQSSDYEAVRRLYQNKQAYGGNYDEQRDTSGRLAATAQGHNLFVARIDGNIVGTFMILDNTHSFWLLRFAVDPVHEDAQKIVDALTAKAQQIAKERGHESIIVYTAAADKRLHERYEQAGFNRGDNYKCYWKEAA